MLLYRNHTRFPAIVTLKLAFNGDEPQPALKIGADKVFDEIKAIAGVHDVLVGPCKEVHTIGDLLGTFMFARAAQ